LNIVDAHSILRTAHLQSIVISLLICSPSWRSGTTIGWLAVGYTKDKARSCVLAWPKSPQTGWRLWAIRISPLHLLGKDKARSYLANRNPERICRRQYPSPYFYLSLLTYELCKYKIFIFLAHRQIQDLHSEKQ